MVLGRRHRERKQPLRSGLTLVSMQIGGPNDEEREDR